MAKLAVLALLLVSASALVQEEELKPLREVSPEEFHTLALRQEVSKGPPKRNLIVQKKTQSQRKEEEKQEELKAHRHALYKATREKEQVAVDEREALQQAVEAEIVAEQKDNIARQSVGQARALKVEAVSEEAVSEDKKVFNWPWQQKEAAQKAEKKQPEAAVEAPTSHFLIKANKTLACTEGNKEIMSFYVSQLAGGSSTKQSVNREKCVRAQLDQHCMPYESFPATFVEPCNVDDWQCANKRVLNDHADCLTKSVDWEAVENYAKESGKTIWEVLGGWCSHVKLLKEVSKRIQLDEKFVHEYPALFVIQDHVILDKEWTEEITKDWVNNYPEKWDMVVLDTAGKGLKKDKVGDFRGKGIYKPSWKGQYAGFHAVLMNTKSVPSLLEKMQSLNVVPVEWVTKSMNDQSGGLKVFSYEAGVTATASDASTTQKQAWTPNNPGCAGARTFKGKY